SNTGGSAAATCLPSSREDASTAARCLTAGWGEMGAGKEELAARLQQAEISLLSHEDCANGWSQNIEGIDICGRAVRAAFCTGDSGWPLICVTDVHCKLAGTASWDSDKCHPKSPTAYIRVSAYRHWISSVTN
ncbi:CTRB1 protein, partial [Ardeotis kori]|nr:CTRB1 protein [Ardeotis kori]